MKKSLQVTGAIALIAWTGCGAFAWYKTRAGVHVTLREGEPEAALPIKLLEDRVGTLATEIDALVASLGQSFTQLTGALEEREAAAELERARLDERLRALEAAVARAAAAVEVAQPLAAVPLQPEPDPVATPPETPPAQPPKKSFLAFALPSRDFRFEGRQTFEILGDLSRVGFDAKSTLHDFTGASSAVRGSFTVDLARPELGIEGAIEIKSSSLDTGLDARDTAMLEHLDSEQHEQIRFEPTAFAPEAPEAVDPEEKTVTGRLRGRMTIRGTTRELEMRVAAHVDDARRLVIEGEAPLLLPDYEVPVPSQLGLISMEKEVRVWIHLRARARLESVAGR
jgi:polyisoprenoid-binding protein YceI